MNEINESFIITNTSACTDYAGTNTGIPIDNSYGDRNLRINHFGCTSYEGNILWFFFKPKLEIGEISSDEAPIQSGALRKYLKITIYNRGYAKAENCDATLTLIRHNSTSKLQPSERDKNIAWDTEQYYRNIGAKKGKAVLYVVFSQDMFMIQQTDSITGKRQDDYKIYAKVCTLNSLNHLDINTIAFAEDGIGIGETYFKLFVKTINGESVEGTFKVHITNNWHDLSMEQVS